MEDATTATERHAAEGIAARCRRSTCPPRRAGRGGQGDRGLSRCPRAAGPRRGSSEVATRLVQSHAALMT
jgi:hypothetical protein